MNRSRLMRRLIVVGAFVSILVVATAGVALQAEPEAASLGLTTAAAWAGHPQCIGVAKASVTQTGGVNVGGYETKLSFDAAKFSYTTQNINLNSYLAVNGRQTSGQSGTPVLQAIGAGNVKWGDYSWGAGAGAGNGTISIVGLNPLVCGTSNLSLSETQVVDTQGVVIPLGTQAQNVPYPIRGIFDANGSGGNVTAADVQVVKNALGSSGACTANYQLDMNNSGGNVTAADVQVVKNQLGQPSCP